MGHGNKNERPLELGVSYIDKTQKGHVWSRGPAPGIQIFYLQYIVLEWWKK